MAARSTWLCTVVCAVLVAVVVAQKSHGGVEDKFGNMVPGATTPKDGKLAPHHFDLFFKTILCVSRFRPPAAPWPPAGRAIPVARLLTATMCVVAQFPELADVYGSRPHYSCDSFLRLCRVGRH